MTVKANMNKKQRSTSPKPRKARKSVQKSGLHRTLLTLFRIIVILFLLVVSWIIYIQWKVQVSPDQTLPKQVDVGIVLGASLRQDIPSPGLQERLDLALNLYKQGKFKQLIVTGGLDHNGSKLTEAEGMRDYLVKKGLPSKSILLEPRATSTYENLLFSKQIMDEQGLVSSIIVTHRYHGSRSLDIAETIGLKQPLISSTKSEVLFMPYHEARETLAYTKWMWTKLLLKTGI
ncbi:protein SanA, affects membrane permeability for vancomycin [Paenibacillus sp. yr247]|uniref:YdcF family protein n=1 Tax=Paenibacillus sp. yr247 TaxID=1761880 RepID=UPI00088E730B|nr:YdcF family protein [Paenibacillus sp. yr247]SDN83807.1 protein SanA, affects membrane permeability for vancomycin [Paenibacillus sp. yr247]